MADNVPITAGSGTNIATDDVAGVHYQRVKLVSGTLEATDAIGGDATNGLDVDVTRVQGTVTVDSELPAAAALGDAAANPTTPTVGSAGLMFNGTTWDRVRGDTTNGLDVDVTRVTGDLTVVGKAADGAAVSGNPVLVAGQDGTNAQSLKTDSSGRLAITDDSGSITIDGSVSVTGAVDTELPAAAALADNAANPTAPAVGSFAMVWDGSTWDRSPGTSTDGTLVNLGTNNDVTVTGTVTVDSELPAAAALADAAANPTTPTAGAAALMFNGTTWDRVRGDTTNGVDVDVTRVSGNVTVVGAAADGAAVSGNPVRVAGKDSAGNTQDIATSTQGAVGVAVLSGRVLDPNAGETLTVKSAVGTVASSGDNDVITAVAGKKIRVLSYALQAQGTVTAKFEDDATATARSMPWKLQDREGVTRVCSAGGFLFETGDGVGLDINLSAAVTVGYEIEYVEVE